ncbi:MAG TPA: type II CAAX endopeptidase family protein, partial [Ktedonobacteraceae bacterium]|nr:type II CAAX endopeptidase family protein [Ktedonobacteraceae bacterium]
MIEPVQDKQLLDSETRAGLAPWTWGQTWLGIALTMLPWMALAIALSSSGNAAGGSKAPLTFQIDLVSALITLIFSALVEGAFLIAPFAIANRVYRAIKSHMQLVLASLGLRKFSIRQAALWIIGFMVLIFVVNILYSTIITTFHLNLQTNDQVILARSKQAPITTYATLIVAVFVAPFCEEVFFRGFVFPGLRNKMPVALAIITSALLFAIAHVDPASFAVLLAIGLMLGVMRWRTNSIWPGILL